MRRSSIRVAMLVLCFIASGLVLSSCWILLPILPSPSADYGDAPDGDRNMEAGYYDFQGSGVGPYTLVPSGTRAQFPTLGSSSIRGPYAIDGGAFFIGPLWPRPWPPQASDIPSSEEDASDASDPDGVPNIDAVAGATAPFWADGDRENGSHNPMIVNGRIGPVLPSVPINARVIIVASFVPPAAVFMTNVPATGSVSPNTAAYWNLSIDLDQNGAWEPTEWVVQDREVTLMPRTNSILLSPLFVWPTYGGGFGRVVFPVWARNMITLESVVDTVGGAWDGRGAIGGFSKGEIEDYFIEWRPIGQMFETDKSQTQTVMPRTNGSPAVIPPDTSELASFDSPATVGVGERISFEPAGPELGAVTVTAIPDPSTGGIAASPVRLELGGAPMGSIESDEFLIDVEWLEGVIRLSVHDAPVGSAIILFGDSLHEDDRRGAGAVGVVGGAILMVDPDHSSL